VRSSQVVRTRVHPRGPRASARSRKAPGTVRAEPGRNSCRARHDASDEQREAGAAPGTRRGIVTRPSASGAHWGRTREKATPARRRRARARPRARRGGRRRSGRGRPGAVERRLRDDAAAGRPGGPPEGRGSMKPTALAAPARAAVGSARARPPASPESAPRARPAARPGPPRPPPPRDEQGQQRGEEEGTTPGHAGTIPPPSWRRRGPGA
jgi:hypothetical protein